MNNNVMNTSEPILFIEDDELFIGKISALLNKYGVFNINICSDPIKIKSDIVNKQFRYSFILLNVSLPGILKNGISVEIIENHPRIPVIIISNDDNIEIAVQYMKQGVLYYYNTKEGIIDELTKKILHGIQLFKSIKPIITQSKKMRLIFKDIGRIAPTSANVLIRGETGVGKELVSEAIHKLSGRTGLFVRANIASFDDTLFADTLFGHEKGAFDGAKTVRKGLIEEARNGTLLLDEIGDLKADSQVRLLRLLEYETFYKLGSDAVIKSNSRIIVATNRNIEEDVRQGKSIESFFQRLNTFTITIPPLRERKEDIPKLVRYFIKKSLKQNSSKLPDKADPKFIDRLLQCDFKGNIRELKGLIENLVNKYSGCEKLILEMIEGFSLNDQAHVIILPSPSFVNPEIGINLVGKNYPNFLEVEACYYREVLLLADGKEERAAEVSGHTKKTLKNRLTAIKIRLKEKNRDFETIPPLTELLKPFTEARDDNKK